MQAFTTTLESGTRRPYDSWVFVVLPAEVVEALGRPPLPVCGTLAGTPFRATAARGDGVVRIPVPADLRERAGVGLGDRVEVCLQVDNESREPDVPPELQVLLDADSGLLDAWTALAPSHRRAWADHVGGAKRPDTRTRRAAAAPEGIRSRSFPR